MLPSIARADVDQAMRQVADDADAVLILPNLTRLSNRAAELSRTLGMDAPAMGDLLGMFQRMTGLTEGVNPDGALLLIVEGLDQAMGKGGRPTLLMLVPVSDYQALLTAYQPEGGDQAAVTRITLPHGQRAYMKKVGDYALMGNERNTVEAYQPGGQARPQLTRLQRKYLGEAEAAVYADVARLAPILLAGLQDVRREVTADSDSLSPQVREQAERSFTLYERAIQSLQQGAGSLLLAVDLADQGVAVTKTVHLKPGSDLAGFFPQADGRTRQAIQRLPKRPFLFAAALDPRGIDLAGMIEALAEGTPEGQAGPTLKMYQQALPLIRGARMFASAVYAPAAGSPGMLTNAVNLIMTPNPPQLHQQLRQYISELNGTEYPVAGVAKGPDGWAPPGPNQTPSPNQQQQQQTPQDQAGSPATMTMRTTYRQDALQLEGVAVDRYRLNFQLPPKAPPRMASMMNMMWGGTGYGGYVAETEDAILTTATLDPQLVRTVLNAQPDGNGGGRGRGITPAVRQQAMPSNPAFEGYLGLQGLAPLWNTFGTRVGLPRLDVPADVPPIAFGLGRTDQTLAGRMYLPRPTLEFIGQTVDRMAPTGEQGPQRQSARPRSLPPAP